MNNSVDHSLEDGRPTVLRHIYAGQRLTCRDPHVADNKLHGIGYLDRKRSFNLLRAQ